MKILVCGATGFMGRNILEHFKKNRNNQVIGIARNRPKYPNDILETDLTDEVAVDELFSYFKPDIVIQAAASTSGIKDTIQHPYKHFCNNAIINSLLLKASADYKVKHFLFLSCGVMYPPSEIPLKETDWKESDAISDIYFGGAWTKIYIEKMCKFYSTFGMKCTAIRHSNTYGPYDKFDPEHSHVLGGTINKVIQATDSISIWGTGEEKRDLVFVSDVVNAIQILINTQTDPFDLVNVSAGYAISVNELAEKIIQQTGKKLTITHDIKKPTVPLTFVYDNSYMRSKYGWVPFIPIDAGLQITIDWYKKHYMENK